MVGIKPDEISAILKQQLSGFTSAAELEEVGTVLQVGDGIARIYGLNGVQAGELVEFETGVQGITLNLEEDNVGVVLMGPGDGIKEGSKVKRTQTIASIDVGEGYIGKKSPFIRTPKFNLTNKEGGEKWKGNKYNKINLNWINVVEILLTCYFIFGLYIHFYKFSLHVCFRYKILFHP